MLKQIKYFQTVVYCVSFSKAAEECYISQSAISQQIQALERELGVVLLKREKRRISLTAAGEHFYQKSLLIAADYERLCRETKQIANSNAHTFSIGYSKGYGGAEFQKAVAEFAAKNPDVPVDVKNGNHEDLYEMLRMEQVDLVLNDQRRAISDEYINTVLTIIGCHIEISARGSYSVITICKRRQSSAHAVYFGSVKGAAGKRGSPLS